MQRRFLRHAATGVSAVAAAGLIAACSSAHPAHAPTASAGLSSAGHAIAPPANRKPPAARLTARLVLSQTRVMAGTPVKGALVVVNRGHTAINLTHGCQPQYVVVLASRRYHPEVTFTSVCSVAPFIIKPGANRLPVTVLTTYLACTLVARNATSEDPACLPGRRGSPPLPTGRYDAVLASDGSALPVPAPVPVGLTAPARWPIVFRRAS
jgi:subtilisin family serine protease